MAVLEWQRATTSELDHARTDDAIVVVPLGSCEQHGPHLAAGTDTYLIEAIVREAATLSEITTPIVVSPSIPVGQSRHHHMFGPTLSVTAQTLAIFLTDLAQSVFRSGFRRLLFLNGHGGNAAVIESVAAELAIDRKVVVGAASYWKMAGESLDALFGNDSTPIPGHAGWFETSLMLALSPELVFMRRLTTEGWQPRRHHQLVTAHIEPRWLHWSPDGYSDDPENATAAVGEQAYKLIIKDVSDVFVTLRDHPFGS